MRLPYYTNEPFGHYDFDNWNFHNFNNFKKFFKCIIYKKFIEYKILGLNDKG